MLEGRGKWDVRWSGKVERDILMESVCGRSVKV